MNSGFRLTITWYNPQANLTIQRNNQYFDFLIDLSFQGVNRLFVLAFTNAEDGTLHQKNNEPTLKTLSYNVILDRRNILINQ